MLYMHKTAPTTFASTAIWCWYQWHFKLSNLNRKVTQFIRNRVIIFISIDFVKSFSTPAILTHSPPAAANVIVCAFCYFHRWLNRTFMLESPVVMICYFHVHFEKEKQPKFTKWKVISMFSWIKKNHWPLQPQSKIYCLLCGLLCQNWLIFLFPHNPLKWSHDEISTTAIQTLKE